MLKVTIIYHNFIEMTLLNGLNGGFMDLRRMIGFDGHDFSQVLYAQVLVSASSCLSPLDPYFQLQCSLMLLNS